MSKNFYKNPIFINIGILVVTAIILVGFVWLVYSKDQPKIIPPETRGKIREGVKEEVVKPVKSVFPRIGEGLSNAEYKPLTTPGQATNNNPVLNNETADWQTYKSPNSFDINYPPEMSATSEGNTTNIYYQSDSMRGLTIYTYSYQGSIENWWQTSGINDPAKFLKVDSIKLGQVAYNHYKELSGMQENHYVGYLKGKIFDVVILGISDDFAKKIIATIY